MSNSEGYNEYKKILRKIIADYNKNVEEKKYLMRDTFLLTLARVGKLVELGDEDDDLSLPIDERDLLKNIQEILRKEAEKWNEEFLSDIKKFKDYVSDQLAENKNEINNLMDKLSGDITQNEVIMQLKGYLNGSVSVDYIVDYLVPLIQSDREFNEFYLNLKKIDGELFELGHTNNCALKNILLDIQYFWTADFNMEAVLMFLYADMDKEPFNHDKCSAVRTVIKKYQQLFQDMYHKLKIVCPSSNLLLDIEVNVPSEINEKIVFLPKDLRYEQPFQPRLIYLRLKKLFALYREFYKVNEDGDSFMPTHLNLCMNGLDLIITDSQLLMPFYVEGAHIVKYITKTLAIHQTDLAKLLGVRKQTVNQSSGQSPLFQAMMNISLTFLCGKTTVPRYGKIFDENARYLIAPIYFRTYATFIIDSINSIKCYDRKIEESNQVIKINQSSDFSEEVSREALRISSALKPFQYQYDRLCKQSNDSKNKIAKLENMLNDYEENLKNLQCEQIGLIEQKENKSKEMMIEENIEEIKNDIKNERNSLEKKKRIKRNTGRSFWIK